MSLEQNLNASISFARLTGAAKQKAEELKRKALERAKKEADLIKQAAERKYQELKADALEEINKLQGAAREKAISEFRNYEQQLKNTVLRELERRRESIENAFVDALFSPAR